MPELRNLARTLRPNSWTIISERDTTKSIAIVSDLTARLSLDDNDCERTELLTSDRLRYVVCYTTSNTA